MNRRSTGWRAAAGMILAAGLSAFVSAGCPWGAANSTGSGGASGDQTIDDGPEAMVGTYRLASVSTAPGDCEELARSDGESGTVEIARMENGPDGEASERLEVRVCEADDGCGGDSDGPEEASFRADELTHVAKGQGWRTATGDASAIDGAPASRRCRLGWTTIKVVREKDGVRIERTERRDEVTLEGNMSCRSQTAEALGEELTCRERTIWRATREPTGDRG